MLLPKQCYGNERLRSFISFSRPQIVLAAAIASLPGGLFLLVFNYLRMGMRKYAFFCLLFASLLSVGLVVFFLSLPASRIDRFFPLLSCVLMFFITRSMPAFSASWLSWLFAVFFALIWLAFEIVLGVWLYQFIHG